MSDTTRLTPDGGLEGGVNWAHVRAGRFAGKSEGFMLGVWLMCAASALESVIVVMTDHEPWLIHRHTVGGAIFYAVFALLVALLWMVRKRASDWVTGKLSSGDKPAW